MRAWRYTVFGIVLLVASVVVYASASFPTAVKSFTTKLAGQTISAAHINDIQDEIVAIETLLLSGPLKPAAGSAGSPAYSFTANTSTGLYSSGSNALELSTNGTKAFGIDSTGFIDSPTQPRARAYSSATQSVTTGTITALDMNSEDYDVGALHDTSSNSSRMTIPVGGDGLYLIIAQTQFPSNATGQRNVRIHKNGSVVGTQILLPATAGVAMAMSVSLIDPAVAGDYYELAVFQSSGGNLNVGNATRVDSTQVQIVKLW